MFAQIDHVGVAVEDLDAAIALHEQAYGLTLAHREVVEAQGVEAVLLDVGESHVELLRPLQPDTAVGRFLAARGPGLHHVAYRVADIEAALDALRDQGLQLTQAIALPDHHDFNESVSDERCELICTEKDAVKLWRQRPQAWAVPLLVQIEPEFWTAFDRLLDAKLSSRHGSQTS